jgi:branched-chain amino acid transport system ATP-binding protein
MRVTLKDVVAGYGFGDVLRGLDLVAEAGEITCLIGPNGAGKSTVLRAVSGLLHPRQGSITLDEQEITGFAPRRLLELGVVHVPQERSLFPLMTVWENVLMGGFIRHDRKAVRRRAEEIAERFPLVHERRSERAGSLSGGEQKTVEIARALMLDPKVLLVDEPSIGLAPRARQQVFATLSSLSDGGWTILLVEQNARSGLAIAHHGAVLDGGVVKLVGTGKQLLADPEVGRLYLGVQSHVPIGVDSAPEPRAPGLASQAGADRTLD